MRILAIAVYIVLQVLFLPLAIIGVVLVAWKQLAVSRRLGVSQTGIEILNGRWTAHVFGLRDDPVTARLAAVLPNTSTLGLWLFLLPLWVQQKISGQPLFYPRVPEEGDEGIADLVAARSVVIDRMLEAGLQASDQFVMLGAGYDCRAFGPLGARAHGVFEVDQAETQALKLQAVQAAGLDTAGVTFLTVDFRSEDLFARLREHGWDPSRRTVFLWEGVTLYLSEAQVRSTLEGICSQAPAGSRVVLDLYGDRMLRMGRHGATKSTLDLTGEGMAFGLDLTAGDDAVVREFIVSTGLACDEVRFLGAKHAKGPYVALVDAVISEDLNHANN